MVLLLVVEWFLHAVCLTSTFYEPLETCQSANFVPRDRILYASTNLLKLILQTNFFISLHVQRGGTKVENIFQEQEMDESTDTCI